MKKNIFVLMLGLLSTLSFANAEGSDRYEWNQSQLIIKGDCTWEEVRNWYEEKNYADLIRFDGTSSKLTLTLSDVVELPPVGEIDFTGECNVVFNSLNAFAGNVPYIYVGKQFDSVQSHLTLTFSEEAIKKALDGRDVADLIEFPIIGPAMFGRDVEAGSQVSFVFGTAAENETYVYTDGEVEQSYLNVGLIPPVSLEKDKAALVLVSGVWNSELGQSWNSTLTVAFVGSNYVAPTVNTPEPTTGTLSLLALAGLAARRRRK